MSINYIFCTSACLSPPLCSALVGHDLYAPFVPPVSRNSLCDFYKFVLGVLRSVSLSRSALETLALLRPLKSRLFAIPLCSPEFRVSSFLRGMKFLILQITYLFSYTPRSIYISFKPHVIPAVCTLALSRSITMENTSAERLFAASSSIPDNFSVPIPRRALTKEAWEPLKPLVQRLWVDENMSYRKIAAIILKEHGYMPTKTQFANRVAQWGFKKNATKDERRKILLEGGKGNVGASGKVVNEATRKRWEKDFRKQELMAKEREDDFAGKEASFMVHKSVRILRRYL